MKPYSSCFFVFAFIICINRVFSKSESEDSYTKHCSSVIPPYNITVRSNGNSLPSLSTSYFTGEDSLLLRMEQGGNRNYVQKNLRLRLRPDYYETTATGVYDVRGLLYIRFPYDAPARRTNRASGSLRFPMNGLWSEESRKLCLIGSAPWRGIDFDAVLKLKFEEENPTIYTGVVSGSLESTAPANDPAFFDPILIFNFLEVSNYKYSLLPKGAFPSRKDESLSLDSTEFCSEMEWGLRVLELEYAAECREKQRPHRCSPLGNGDGFLPRFLSLIPIHCDKGAKKARFVATFRNQLSYLYNSFPPASTAIGEASWDEKNHRITGVACEILNPSLQLGKVVGDCTISFSLWNPSVLTIRSIDSRISGEIWISKSDDNSGYVRKINLTATNENRVLALSEQRYEYTELVRARNSCTAMKRPSKKGYNYPDGQSYDMRFDFNIKNGNGDVIARASATPVWVDDDPYQSRRDLVFESGPAATESDAESLKRRTKISYEIKIHLRNNLNYSNNIWSRRVDMAAEGLYDAENGHLCMVGCMKLFARNSTSTYKDCEVVLEFKIPLLSWKRGGIIKGILRSRRPETDALHFNDLVMESAAYNRGAAERSVWRMDMEMAMVLASNALVCIFVALQILHLRKIPEVLTSVSLVMALILTVGNIVPLVVNFEAVQLGNGGRLEANEVAVRIITMVALLLQLRLLQLVYSAKQSDDSGENSWCEEKRAGFVSFSLYILGGLLTLLLNSMRSGQRYSVWGDLRSYAGVILDGFLLPQILLNIFGGFAEKALCGWFYIGTSVVRLVPHAYSQYMTHNYPEYDIKGTYYYANPAADLYTTAWDIIIPGGIVALAVIVFMQQRKGGRSILPQRFRALEMYDKVATTADNP